MPDSQPGSLPPDRAEFIYRWPDATALKLTDWQISAAGDWMVRPMPESRSQLAADSRWPAMFPSAVCIVTSSDGKSTAIEKVVGASIVNRFPYTLALSFCREALSDRHYERNALMSMLEKSGQVAVQFLFPSSELKRALDAIATIPEPDMAARMAAAAPNYRRAPRTGIPVLPDAYLVYEGRFVKPGSDFDGELVNPAPFIDCGSHRIYMFEIVSISLRQDIASGARPIHWRSLPVWRGAPSKKQDSEAAQRRARLLAQLGFKKAYRPDYVFPSTETVAFEGTPEADGFSVLDIPPLPEDQVEVDNDSARWPCFFPSSLGVITARTADGVATAFPCGSTTIVSRSPLTFAICVSYARINARYAPRASLEILRRSGRFVCSTPIYREEILEAVSYLGNVSLRADRMKVRNSGLTPVELGHGFGFAELPVHFDCRIVKEVRLGTHAMLLGEVESIFVNRQVTSEGSLEWCPWAGQLPPLLQK